MDKQIAKHSARWKQWLLDKNMDEYYATFSKCIEQATIKFAQHQGNNKPYKGRGTVNIVNAQEAPRATYNVDMQAMVTPLTREGTRLLLQVRRISSVRDNLRSLQKILDGQTCNSKEHTLRAHLKGTIAKLKGDWAIHDGFRGTFLLLDPNDLAAKPTYIVFTRIINEWINRCQDLSKQACKTSKEYARLPLKTKGAHKAISSALKGKQPAPMSYLVRPTSQGEGKPKGSIATCPKDIDAILHHIWDPITDGNASNPKQQANNFVRKYKGHIFKADEFALGGITAGEFKAQSDRKSVV